MNRLFLVSFAVVEALNDGYHKSHGLTDASEVNEAAENSLVENDLAEVHRVGRVGVNQSKDRRSSGEALLKKAVHLVRSERLQPIRTTTTSTVVNETEMLRLFGPTTTTTLPCADITADWQDSNGDYCSTYEAGGFCTPTKGYGPGWGIKSGYFSDYKSPGDWPCPNGWSKINNTCFSPARSTGTYVANNECVVGNCVNVYAHCQSLGATVTTKEQMHAWWAAGNLAPAGKSFGITSTYSKNGKQHWLVNGANSDVGWHDNGCCNEGDHRFFVCAKENVLTATDACCACGGGTVPYVAPTTTTTTTATTTTATTTPAGQDSLESSL